MEMEVKDLRIGNIIYLIEEKSELIVKDIILDDEFKELGYYIGLDDGYRYDEKMVKGIPLTEDLLLKVGAFPEGNGMIIERFKLIYKPGYKYWYIIDDLSKTYLTKIIYLHELQNFYYSMQTKELTIK